MIIQNIIGYSTWPINLWQPAVKSEYVLKYETQKDWFIPTATYVSQYAAESQGKHTKMRCMINRQTKTA